MMLRAHMPLVALVAVVVALLLAPARAAAQDNPHDVLVRVNGTVDLPASESVDVLVAVNSPATVAGTVRDTLVIVNQDATVSGEIGQDAVVWNGSLRLEPTARIGGDVVLMNSEVNQAAGAAVSGQVVERSGASVGAELNRATTFFSFVAWLGMTLLFVVVALVWAAIGGAQLSGVAGLLGARPGLAVLAAIIVWIVLPIVAVLAFITVIGIPIGLALFLVVVPLLWSLGYVTTGTRLGFFLDDLRHAAPNLAHPYLAAALGIIVLQLIGLIPVVGWIVVALAGLIGAGAIAVQAWRRVSAPGTPPDLAPLEA